MLQYHLRIQSLPLRELNNLLPGKQLVDDRAIQDAKTGKDLLSGNNVLPSLGFAPCGLGPVF
jgi:hypothetical protein